MDSQLPAYLFNPDVKVAFEARRNCGIHLRRPRLGSQNDQACPTLGRQGTSRTGDGRQTGHRRNYPNDSMARG